MTNARPPMPTIPWRNPVRTRRTSGLGESVGSTITLTMASTEVYHLSTLLSGGVLDPSTQEILRAFIKEATDAHVDAIRSAR